MQTFLKWAPSPFGPVAIIWINENDPVIARIVLSDLTHSALEKVDQQFPEARKSSCSEIDRISGQIIDYLEGIPISFDLNIIRLEHCPYFQQKVLRAEHRIPRGRVSTYGRIAGHLENSGAARAVGNALASNPFPIIIPCHRAIRSDLTLGGYQGGTAMKRKLLEMEGHEVDEKGQVVRPKLYY